jgi:RNase H-fold protein (predicted Holliday junction resolvase)
LAIKRKRSNVVATPKPVESGEYTAERFLKRFEGMTNKEIQKTIYLVDDGLKFEEAVEQVKRNRVATST